MNYIKELEKKYQKENLPEIKSGDTVAVHLKIKEKDKTRIQVFEGIVIKRRGGNGLSGTFTVRKIGADGIGVERTFFLHSPVVAKIKIIKKGKVKRSQLYYLRQRHIKQLKLKEKKEYRGILEWEEEKTKSILEKTENKEKEKEIKEEKEAENINKKYSQDQNEEKEKNLKIRRNKVSS